MPSEIANANADTGTADRRLAARRAWGLSAAATLVWLVVVLAAGLGERVLDNWRSALTMLFGSFLAGSSPEGGGAVAFPVFTKALHVPGPVARTFGLSIQAVGMSMAVAAILIYKRPIHARAAVIGSVAGVVGFLISVAIFGQSELPFWPSTIGAPWVKASFSIVLATTSILLVRHLLQHSEAQHHAQHDVLPHDVLPWTPRLEISLIGVALVGGLLSSLTGTGANILVFLFLIVLVGVNPKVALPTAIIVMTAISVVGFVLFSVIDGQLDVALDGDRVVSVGGQAIDAPASESDLLGLWVAAVPVVVWGAPLGSLVAARVPESWLVKFVATLAAFEVMTTIVLVHELRTDPALIAYLAVGLLLLPATCVWLGNHRHQLFTR